MNCATPPEISLLASGKKSGKQAKSSSAILASLQLGGAGLRKLVCSLVGRKAGNKLKVAPLYSPRSSLAERASGN